MKEIEVKAKISNKTEIVDKLTSLGFLFSKPITQHDFIFLHNTISSYNDITSGTNVLRIRKQEGKIKFTLKKAVENELSCIEHEIVLNNAEQMRKILGYLHYDCLVEVKKTRQKANQNGISICVDHVEELGTFIEVEKMTHDTDLENVQEELFIFLESLGIKREDRVHQGYDTMIYYKKNTI